MERLLLLLLATVASVAAFCPDVFVNQTACSCYDYLDGAVIRCSGAEGPLIIEKLKATHVEIRELTLEKANIVEIGPRAFKNLRIKKLSLDKNRIKAFHPAAFDGLQNVLQELSIAENRLTKIPTEAIEGLRGLNILNLRCNRIQDLNETAFENVPSLIDINLSCNQICSINEKAFENIRFSLQSLTLDNNCLTEFPSVAFQGMENLIALHLKSNLINDLPEASLTNLTSLSMLILTGNNISSIHSGAVSNCPNLRYLYMAENALSTLSSGIMAQFDQAQVVDLSFNHLSFIPADTFSGLENLQHINLESNAIKEVSPGAFSGTPLLLLWLPNNCITNVSANMFQGAPFLRQVSLSNNNIDNIEPMSFAHLVNLHTLDLAFNKIVELRSNAITGSDHLTVRLQENPFVCGEDGFHVMNGNEAINLTTEANIICRTNWRIPKKNVCPKEVPRPAAAPCCDKPKPIASTTTTTTTEIPPSIVASTSASRSASSEEDSREHTSGEMPVMDDEMRQPTTTFVPLRLQSSASASAEEPIPTKKLSVVDLKEDDEDEEEEDDEEIEESEEVTPVMQTSPSTTEAPSTIPSVVTEKQERRKVNMERFMRLSQQPAAVAAAAAADAESRLRSRFSALQPRPELPSREDEKKVEVTTEAKVAIATSMLEKESELRKKMQQEKIEFSEDEGGDNEKEDQAVDGKPEDSVEYEDDEEEEEEEEEKMPSEKQPSSTEQAPTLPPRIRPQTLLRPVPARVSARQRLLPPWLRMNKPASKPSAAVQQPEVDFNEDEPAGVSVADELPIPRRVVA